MTRYTPALRDENHKAVGLGVSSSDGVTPVMLRVDPVTDYLLVSDNGATVIATYRRWSKRDENDVPTIYGISSIDGVTLVPIRTDKTGRLLIQYT